VRRGFQAIDNHVTNSRARRHGRKCDGV